MLCMHWLETFHTCVVLFTHAFTMYAEHLINSNMVGQKRGVGPGIYEVIRCSQLDSIGGARTVVRVSPVFFRIVSSTHWGFKAVAWRPDWQVTCSMRVPFEFINTLWMHVWIKKYMYAKLLVNANEVNDVNGISYIRTKQNQTLALGNFSIEIHHFNNFFNQKSKSISLIN